MPALPCHLGWDVEPCRQLPRRCLELCRRVPPLATQFREGELETMKRMRICLRQRPTVLHDPPVTVHLDRPYRLPRVPLAPERHRKQRVPGRAGYPHPVNPVILVHATKGYVIEHYKQIAVGKLVEVAEPRQVARLVRGESHRAASKSASVSMSTAPGTT